MFQNVLRVLISILVVVLALLSGFGMVWWKQPPDPIAHYQHGGEFILGLLIASSAVGLWVLWRDPRHKT